jgi:DNA-binding FadR family transcriptional regulator
MDVSNFTDNLKSIDTSTLVDKVEAKLVALLKERKLKVGDSIPKEMELAETLGVSRTVIREALLRMRMLGLIDSKRRRAQITVQIFEHWKTPNLICWTRRCCRRI